jgi:hypothetical protein
MPVDTRGRRANSRDAWTAGLTPPRASVQRPAGPAASWSVASLVAKCNVRHTRRASPGVRVVIHRMPGCAAPTA